MVDYALSIDPLQAESPALISESIDNLRRRMPLGTVNHTDFDALRNRPIAVSIETKRRGERGIKAEAQISTWHSAQWKFLTRLVGPRISTLPFIPALIVIGDEWKFVASTQANGKTVSAINPRYSIYHDDWRLTWDDRLCGLTAPLGQRVPSLVFFKSSLDYAD